MFAGFPVHHMTDNVRVRWIQGRTLLRPRDRKGTAQTQYKYNVKEDNRLFGRFILMFEAAFRSP